MILGITATSLTFVALIVSIVAYYLFFKRNDDELRQLGRTAFYFASGLIFFQASMLMYGLLTHQFQWQYVFSYSSTDLSLYYLISTFWAGQEGTFMLWLTLGSIYGIIIMSMKTKDEPMVMSYMALVQAFIVLILIKKNPFSYVWDVNPNHFQAGIAPLDGNGLNPLLQDPWMIIHPPVLFVGYSSTMTLFAFAMAALIGRDYDEWIKRVFPFGLFSALALGTGIVLGGYWAYTTLGWGGYWAWDPVENSSFIPWLAVLAFVHGVLIQRRQDGLKKTNIFMALLAFLLVLWGSFLTRSGVLADFSVHSFSETEINTYLTAFVAFFGGIAILGYLFRVKNLESERVSDQLVTRGSFMLFGVLALLISAVFTFFGTSAPILTGLFTGEAANVSIEYYNLLNAPIAVLMGVFIALSPVLSWKKESGEKLKGVVVHAAAAVVLSVVAFFLGLVDPMPLLIFALFAFVIFVNGEIVFRMMKKGSWDFGGYLAHVGIGFMMIGIITSSVYSSVTKTTLPLDSSKNVMGYDMKYIGFREGADGKNEAVIEISANGGSAFESRPKFYWSKFNQAYMRNPDVHNLWLKDLYVSPIQVIPPEESEPGATLKVVQDQPQTFEDLTITLLGYDMGQHGEGNASEMRVAAKLQVVKGDETYEIQPTIVVRGDRREVLPDKLPGTDREVTIQGISVEEKSLTLGIGGGTAIDKPAPKELLAVEITEKPLINLLWLGTFIMMGGMIVSIHNRVKVRKL
jgi:cytochrome c-type biogenesis protein CcmF